MINSKNLREPNKLEIWFIKFMYLRQVQEIFIIIYFKLLKVIHFLKRHDLKSYI